MPRRMTHQWSPHDGTVILGASPVWSRSAKFDIPSTLLQSNYARACYCDSSACEDGTGPRVPSCPHGTLPPPSAVVPSGAAYLKDVRDGHQRTTTVWSHVVRADALMFRVCSSARRQSRHRDALPRIAILEPESCIAAAVLRAMFKSNGVALQGLHAQTRVHINPMSGEVGNPTAGPRQLKLAHVRRNRKSRVRGRVQLVLDIQARFAPGTRKLPSNY